MYMTENVIIWGTRGKELKALTLEKKAIEMARQREEIQQESSLRGDPAVNKGTCSIQS